MARWLLKSEPSDYAYSDLERDHATRWDGVSNNAALKNIRAVREGDEALVYHTGDERAVAGIARVASDPYADPNAADSRLVVFDLVPVRPLARPVTLAEIKADPAFEGFDLVRLPRLSVMPVGDEFWERILLLSSR